jgi:UDP-2-acetamido-3-amino-2,3-dideoxy-glucuronate N-acetyltransferase
MTGDPLPDIAVVGWGNWGKNLVRNFHELGSLRAICDVDESRLEEMAAEFGVAAIHDFDQLLETPDLQGIVIAAPAAQHFELARRALLAGKDVFVEKPIALHLEEGEELVEIARRNQRILMVGHLLLYHPAILELKRLICAGELGKIQYIYSSRLNWGKLRTEENILWSFAPHDISAVLFLLGEEPTGVEAHGGSYLNPQVPDTTLSTFSFPSGVQAHIFVSWLHPFKEQRLIVVGGRKLAVFDDTEKERKLLLYPHRIDWVDRVPVAHKMEGEPVTLDSDEPLRLECQHFLECVQTRKKPRTDGESALSVLRILEQCEKSLRKAPERPAPTVSSGRSFIHPTAVIDEPCTIGRGTRIWHFTHIMQRSTIGENCILGQNVHIASGVRIGNNVKIQNNVSVYAGVELEDDVFCGPSMVFTNVVNPRSHVNRKEEYQRTLVRRGATLGANSTIVCGVSIGEYAFIGAGAVVTRDVPDHALVRGVPARQVGWMCRCGVRLQIGERATTCSACGESYVLYGESPNRQPQKVVSPSLERYASKNSHGQRLTTIRTARK